jgi:hypothetical protein
MRLHRTQICPIHHSRLCCGREAVPQERRTRQIGIRRIDDPHHPRGYRELRSNAEMRKLLNSPMSRAMAIFLVNTQVTHGTFAFSSTPYGFF